MSGNFTRKMYDSCAAQQDLKQSTDPLELVLDVNKYVHCNNICRPTTTFPQNAAQLVDVESSLWGIDKLSSRCDSAKHPFCGPNGCLLTRDPRIAPHTTPYLCERGRAGDNAVITTNMQIPTSTGVRVPNPNVCNQQGNGYYVSNLTDTPKILTPAVLAPQPNGPVAYKQNTDALIPPLRNQQVNLPVTHSQDPQQQSPSFLSTIRQTINNMFGQPVQVQPATVQNAQQYLNNNQKSKFGLQTYSR